MTALCCHMESEPLHQPLPATITRAGWIVFRDYCRYQIPIFFRKRSAGVWPMR